VDQRRLCSDCVMQTTVREWQVKVEVDEMNVDMGDQLCELEQMESHRMCKRERLGESHVT
jgi:hypothetical protein